jgi:hypothetical protein
MLPHNMPPERPTSRSASGPAIITPPATASGVPTAAATVAPGWSTDAARVNGYLKSVRTD